MKTLFFISIFFLLIFTYSYSQNKPDSLSSEKDNATKIFIDCSFCYEDFIRTEITFVNYVRDVKQAEVYVLITTQETGSGGKEYTMTFVGQKNYLNRNDTLKFTSKKSETEDNIRKGLVNTLKLGLIPYISKTPFAQQLSITFAEPDTATQLKDKWKSWVFNNSINGYGNGQKSTQYISLHGNISADKVTPNWKLSFSTGANYSENKFIIFNDTIKSNSRGQSLRGLVVKSINNHWSAGGSIGAYTSTYDNTKLLIYLYPAVEWNLFPYTESTRKQFRFLYKTGCNQVLYNEETIYDKTNETLFTESLSTTLELKQKWGSVSASVEGSHYFHDFNKNNVSAFSSLNLRIFEGFSIRLFGSVSIIHDQLSLPKLGATAEEILLQRKQLATTYNYYASVGLTYTFGSIYNNVVNPRFGGGGGGTVYYSD